MPIIIPKALPAFSILNDENVFVMPKVRAETQDIRPIEIAIVNLMPTKIETETQLMRLLGNSSLQVNVTLIKMGSYESKNTSAEHLDKFYQTFDEIKDKKFDGMIVTGAPVETLPFEQVMYWEELTQIMDYADKNVTSTIFICWGAQAGLNYYYGIQKPLLQKKMFGIYPNKATMKFDKLLKGMDDVFYIPFSRHSTVDENAIRANEHLEVLAECIDGGISIVKSVDNRKFFFMGHSEYDRDTLKTEYLRDLAKGEKIDPPINYFVNGDLNNINVNWRSTANLLYYNWLNYYVYQVTPYDIVGKYRDSSEKKN